VRTTRRRARLGAVLAAVLLVAAACGDDDDTADDGTGGTEAPSIDGTDAPSTEGTDAPSTEGTDAPDTEGTDAPAGAEGGELIDLGTFVGDPPEHIDPALNATLDAYQVINALYDGLTDLDASDPANTKIVPHVAESYEPNDDGTVWTFTIREGVEFSDGEAVLPSSFVRGWERAADLAGDYSYLLTFIDGGTERLEGTADTISGVVADDDAMTLTVTLDKPYSNFDAVAGFQLFMPMPSAVEELADQNDWENGIMIGNGPFVMEEARTDEEIVLVRNDNWGGDIFGNTRAILDKITFRTLSDPDTSYNSFEAGEGDTAQIPPGRVSDAERDWGNTLDVDILGSYHWVIPTESPIVGGPENKLLRQAISQAIDRDEINESVYNGSRTTSTGVTPPGIPGFKADLCPYCVYDLDAAQAAFDEWTAAGNSLSEPIPLQFNADAGHEPVAQIVIDNLAQIGIEAVAEPMPSETYFSQLADGACKALCRHGWIADYPTYDNFMYDLFHGDAIGGNNNGPFINAEFDALVDEAKQTVDKDAQAALFQEAESILLEEVGVIPMNWYRGDYVYNDEKIANFPQTNFMLILWEQVALKG
jgi:oligopeptide transport system substrate-binding protein